MGSATALLTVFLIGVGRGATSIPPRPPLSETLRASDTSAWLIRQAGDAAYCVVDIACRLRTIPRRGTSTLFPLLPPHGACPTPLTHGSLPLPRTSPGETFPLAPLSTVRSVDIRWGHWPQTPSDGGHHRQVPRTPRLPSLPAG